MRCPSSNRPACHTHPKCARKTLAARPSALCTPAATICTWRISSASARYLAAHRDAWSGTVLFVFQPAEELGAGADAMIQDGLFSRFPRPDFAVALHDSADEPTGEIGYRAGFAMANIDSVDIAIKGRGGHGASPESTIDPIVIAAKFILDLQTIVSREMKPIEPAVVTVGSIHAGTKHNIISDECRLQLTLRSLSPQVRKQLQDAVRRKALAAAASAGAPEPTVEISEGTPALVQRSATHATPGHRT